MLVFLSLVFHCALITCVYFFLASNGYFKQNKNVVIEEKTGIRLFDCVFALIIMLSMSNHATFSAYKGLMSGIDKYVESTKNLQLNSISNIENGKVTIQVDENTFIHMGDK